MVEVECQVAFQPVKTNSGRNRDTIHRALHDKVHTASLTRGWWDVKAGKWSLTRAHRHAQVRGGYTGSFSPWHALLLRPHRAAFVCHRSVTKYECVHICFLMSAYAWSCASPGICASFMSCSPAVLALIPPFSRTAQIEDRKESEPSLFSSHWCRSGWRGGGHGGGKVE